MANMVISCCTFSHLPQTDFLKEKCPSLLTCGATETHKSFTTFRIKTQEISRKNETKLYAGKVTATNRQLLCCSVNLQRMKWSCYICSSRRTYCWCTGTCRCCRHNQQCYRRYLLIIENQIDLQLSHPTCHLSAAISHWPSDGWIHKLD